MDEKQKLRIIDNMVGNVAGLILTGLWIIAYRENIILLQFWQLCSFLAGFWSINALLTYTFLSGKNLKHRHPSLALTQIIWACFWVLISHFLIIQYQGAITILVLLVLLFGILRLPFKHFLPITIWINLSYIIHMWAKQRIIPNYDLYEDIIYWVVLSFALLISLTLNLSTQALKARLTRNQERLKKALETKSRFLANMSHEVRTPMNGIIGTTELLQYTELNTEQKQYIDIIKNSSTLLLSIINDVLDLSKIEAGKLTLEKTSLNLQDIAKESINMFSHNLQHKAITLELNYDEKLPSTFIGDGFRIRQILLNLISNAIKFTQEGSISINVMADKATSPNRTIQPIKIEVIDTGIGIEESKLSVIFSEFGQADDSTTRLHGGTGLGLSICQQLAQAMGGDITVTSQVSKGSTFTVTLPLMVGNASLYSSPTNTDSLKNKCILLAEDNGVNQILMKKILERLQIKTLIANDGLEAIQIFERSLDSKQPIDLILMDCQMPQLDGLESTRHIRKLPQGKHIPIIAITANSSPQDRQEIASSGMNDMISKPVDRNQLEHLLVQYMSHSNTPV